MKNEEIIKTLGQHSSMIGSMKVDIHDIGSDLLDTKSEMNSRLNKVEDYIRSKERARNNIIGILKSIWVVIISALSLTGFSMLLLQIIKSLS